MDQASGLLGTVKNDSCFPTLTFKERMTGFAVCFVLGR
jgi:threonine synthase